MDDKGRRREAVGNAPTTPALPSSLPHAQTAIAHLAKGSDPQSTLAAQDADRVDPSGDPAAIGHFIVRRRLGAGGMGVVYAGEDANLGRPVAIKLVRSDVDHPAYRERLKREAQAMARLEHPNVVKVYEIGEDAGRLFIAMELVEGVTLGSWLAKRRTWREIVDMFKQVGAGLLAVHRVGLVHRDFKPDNVLVDHDGHARVADFGLARLDVGASESGSPLAAPLTKTGAMMGTPGYMAPEQQFGGDVDARADQYSFCVALREALGGRPLDEARWKEVPKLVRTIVGRGLSYDASERFASLEELLAALSRVRGGAVSARRAGLAAVIVAAAAATVIGVVVSQREATPVRADANNDLVNETARRNAAIIAAAKQQNDDRIRAALQDAAVESPVPVVVVAKPDGGVRMHHEPAVARVDAGIVLPPPENDLLKDYKKLRKPAATVGDPAHLPAIRATLRNIGYEGIDLGALDRDPAAMQKSLEAELAGQTGDDAAITSIKLGMVKRRRGDCAGAQELWREARLSSNAPEPGPLWSARGSLGFSICEVEAGDWDDAYHVVMKAYGADRDEVQLVMALIAYDRGDHEDAHARMIKTSHAKSPRVIAALKTWLDATGLVL